MIYSVHFEVSENYQVYKTTYDGVSQNILNGSSSSSDVDITEGDGYYYILDSTSSIIKKYDKTTDMKIDELPIYGEVKQIFLFTGIS